VARRSGVQAIVAGGADYSTARIRRAAARASAAMSRPHLSFSFSAPFATIRSDNRIDARSTTLLKLRLMAALIRIVLVCVVVASAGVASAGPAPKPPARQPAAAAKGKLTAAQQLAGQGNYKQALVLIEEGLALEPRTEELLALLNLKGQVLLDLRDLTAALAAFQAYIAAGATGRNRREVLETIKNIVAAPQLEITLANGPADVYLESKAFGVFCTAAPSCTRPVWPGDYKVIVERPGFQPPNQRVTVAKGKPAAIAITLVEKPSLLTVRVAQPGAQITVDDKAYDAPGPVDAGTHPVVVALAGHVTARLEAVAHEGKPVPLDVSLTPLVPIHVDPPGADLVLDGKAVSVENGGLAVGPGKHSLAATAPGRQRRVIEILGERPADYQIELQLSPASPPAVAEVKPSLFTLRRKVAIASGGVGVVAGVVGIVLGLQARQADHDAFALCPSPSTPCSGALKAAELNLHGQQRASQANVAFGVAGAGVVAAAVLWMIGAPESRVAVTPHAGAVAGLDVAVRF
jgi:PEGA domain-containing protein